MTAPELFVLCYLLGACTRPDTPLRVEGRPERDDAGAYPPSFVVRLALGGGRVRITVEAA